MISRQEKLSPENEQQDELPKAWECIAHLRLLTVFTFLREDISRTENLFFKDAGIQDVAPGKRKIFIEEKRWTIYVSRAVKRFERWFQTQVKWQSNLEKVTTKTCTSKGGLQRLLYETQPFIWSSSNLPPIDVLMVLHSFMLNPRYFLDDCLRLGMVALWKAGMPWQLINEHVRDRDFAFDVCQESKGLFQKNNGMQWDNFEDRESDLLSCPFCNSDKALSSASSGMDWLADKEFSLLCSLPCRNPSHLHAAQLSQLSDDIGLLEDYKTPLKATILSSDGLAESQTSLRPATLFPSRLLTLIDQRDLEERIRAAQSGDKGQTVSDLFTSVLEQSKSKSSKLRTAKSNPLSSSFTDAELYSFNRAKLAYSEGPSLFSLDLTGAVLRQGKFVQQMRDIDWIHSPGITNTMENLIEKYDVFVDIMRLSKKIEVSVPTLAVDLAWHTQQLSPEKYYIYSIRNINGVFVDHDDRIGEGDLEISFKRTSEMFKRLTEGGEYSECLCWNCAAMNERGFDGEKFKDGQNAAKLEELKSLANDDVREAQEKRFVDDYNRYKRNVDSENWEAFLETYTWPYPDSVPAKERLAKYLA